MEFKLKKLDYTTINFDDNLSLERNGQSNKNKSRMYAMRINNNNNKLYI